MRCRHVFCSFALASALASVGGDARAQGSPMDPAALEEAKKHMKAGAAFYNDPSGHPKCEEALREFTKAFELSGSLNARKGMAICNLELERDGDAIRDYAAYLEGKGSSIEAAEKKQIEADLSALRAGVATIEIVTDRSRVRITDVRTPSRGFPIRNTYVVEKGELSIQVHPGQHTLTASVEGSPDEVWQVDIPNAGKVAHTFSFQAAKAPGPAIVIAPPPVTTTVMVRPVPVAVWVTAGLGGALGIAWGALAVRAKIANGDYDDLNGKASRATLEAMRSDVKTANLTADVFLVAAGATLATSAILYLVRPSKPGASSAPRASGLTLRPMMGASCGGVAVGGSF